MEQNTYVRKLSILIVLAGLMSLAASCTTSFQDRQIKDMPGEWEVFKTTTLFADFLENGFNPLEPRIEESGDLGIFDFSQRTVNYTYLRNDTLYTGSGDYSIDRERNSQKIIFSSDEAFLLLPPDQMPHNLIFNGTGEYVIMILNFTPEELGPGQGYTLFLRKID